MQGAAAGEPGAAVRGAGDALQGRAGEGSRRLRPGIIYLQPVTPFPEQTSNKPDFIETFAFLGSIRI